MPIKVCPFAHLQPRGSTNGRHDASLRVSGAGRNATLRAETATAGFKELTTARPWRHPTRAREEERRQLLLHGVRLVLRPIGSQ
jgi:hypothetical protein